MHSSCTFNPPRIRRRNYARALYRPIVGALAMARYSVKSAAGRMARAVAIREHVTVSAQSAGLPYRAPLWMTVTPVDGVWSDIQAFGYDEGSVSRAERARVRKQAQATWWRLSRQELYMTSEEKPFAVLEWKQTLNGISIVHMYSPPDPE